MIVVPCGSTTLAHRFLVSPVGGTAVLAAFAPQYAEKTASHMVLYYL
ncbi:unnamed protein product [Tenebrio molitor]|nr:unnamed protein product [Tenebrio molitor]